MKRINVIFLCLLFISLKGFSQTDDFKRHLVRAETAFKMGKLQEAVIEYSEAIKIEPQNGNLYYNLASVQEKIGTPEAYSAAIANYRKYVELTPDATDKDEVMSKTYALEFKLEDKVKTTKQLDNLNGIWRSNMFVKKTGLPLWAFDFRLINDELRITVIPKSLLYKKDFTYQTVTIPFNEKAFAFAYTNDKVTAANNNDAEHSMVDILSSQSSNASVLNPLMHGLLNATATEGFQILSSYIFKLKIVGDSMVGTMQTIEKRNDGKGSKIIRDEITPISFNKNESNYPIPEPTAEEKKAESLSQYYLKDAFGLKFGMLMSSGSEMNELGLESGMSLGFMSTIIHFSSKNTPVKLGMYLSDEIDVILGKKNELIGHKDANVLTNISFNIGPAISIFPAYKTNFSVYYNLRPSMLFDFTGQIIPGDFKFVFMQGYGINFRYKRLLLNYQSNAGTTKFMIMGDKDNLGNLKLNYSFASVGITF
ncbi:MAG: tetratricopeptide repeat protein [Bacteroidales bacterium]|nr:tetratricopeptide repeat protein [Bacteroidales bacterium]